jgi:hypothetical protein
MSILSDAQMQAAKQFIFRHGRLLERQLFETLFGNGTIRASLRALLAYQNADGGFGNGIEPDLLCPDSTAIGAESAMFVMELLGTREPEVLEPLLKWIADHQNEAGVIPHPPAALADFPHQPWWRNSDADRVLALAGYLKKWGIEDSTFSMKVRGHYAEAQMPGAGSYYGYPYFVYLKYCGENAVDEARLATMVGQLPVLLETHADHHPLFSRAWFHAADCVAPETLEAEAQAFAAAMQEDGGLAVPYPDLPWWRPLWTLEGLVLLRRLGFL